jgi:FkbM family methyltransferase
MNTDELYTELERQYFSEEMQEKDEIELLPKILQGVKTFVDVGASLGQYAYFSGKIIKGGRIVCVEADPVRYERLNQMAHEWQKTSENTYEVINAAASDKEGRTTFFVTDESLCGGLFKYWVPDDPALIGKVNWREVEIACVTLDSMFPDGNADLIKIDVEGAEYRVIEGAANLLTKGHSRFLVEIHPWGDSEYSKTPSDVFRIFHQYGYDFSRTHRHWLFQKTNQKFIPWIKFRLITVVMNNTWIKDALKRIVLKLSSSSRR